MKQISLFIAAMVVISLFLSLPATDPIGAHAGLRVAITPTVSNYLPLVAKNWLPGVAPAPTHTPTATPTPTSMPPAVTVVTDRSGKARILIGGQAIDLRPFDPETPGLPLPAVKITAKEHPSHVIILWQDTLGDRPPPFFRSVAEFLRKPLEFSSRSMPLEPVSDAGSGTNMIVLDDPPEGWDVSGPEIIPNMIGEYKGPVTVSGPDFATYVADHFPEVEHIEFYHLDAVPLIETAVMDIYETDVDGVIAVNLRDQGSEPPVGEPELVATELIWHKLVSWAVDDVAAGVGFVFSAITKWALEDWNARCIPVPDVTGEDWDRDRARTVLEQMGFYVEEIESYSYAEPDQVIDQYPGPKNISRCRMAGDTVKIAVSIGPKPTEYTLDRVSVTDERRNSRTEFARCEDVSLWVVGVNHRRNDLTVSYGWNTYGPDDEQIESLSQSDLMVEVRPDWVDYQRLDGIIPADAPISDEGPSGEYTFEGSATFTQTGGTEIALKRRAFFRVSDGQGSLSLVDAVTCKDVNWETGEPVDITSVFNTQDTAVYAWSSWYGAPWDHSYQWNWYRPGGNLFLSYSLTYRNTTCAPITWGYLNIAGTVAVNYPGDWHVDIYKDGQFSHSLNFTLVSAAGSDSNTAFVTSEKGSGQGMASGFETFSVSELNVQPRR